MGWTVVGWLASGLVAALAATGIQVWLHRRYDQRERRRDVLRRLVGNRHFLRGDPDVQSNAEPYISLNEIFVVFANYPDVVSAVKQYHRTHGLDDLLTLIKVMAKASDVPIDNVNDEFILRPFGPGKASRKQP